MLSIFFLQHLIGRSTNVLFHNHSSTRHIDKYSRTQSEQKDLLEAEQSREVFKKVKDDSSSLVVIRDSASLLSASTNTTENSSKLSMRFMFDGELLQSKVYQGTIRSLLRRAMHGATATGSITLQSNLYKSPEERKEMKTRSRHIDRILHRDKLIENREFQILVHGRHQSGKSTICRMLELASSAEDSQSRYAVLDVIREAII